MPEKPTPQSDHELTCEALRLANALDAIAADRDRLRDMTSLRERLMLAAWLAERPTGGRPQ
jgi:hypothetical protein